MEWVSVLLFALALSLDGFAVGVSYGIRKIKIPVLSLCIISLTSVCAISVSMLGGQAITKIVSLQVAETVGAAILITVGGWIICQTRLRARQSGQHGEADERNGEKTELLKIQLRPLGLVIQIIREPVRADIDRSGVISWREAFLLGLALAMDALAAGLGAAMTGFRPYTAPVIVGVTQFVLVGTGDWIGRRYAARWLGEKAATVHGWVLVLLGVVRVIKL